VPEPGWTLARVADLSPAQAEAVPLPVLAEVVEVASDDELAGHPYALLHLARALEPGQRLSRRTSALARLAALHPSEVDALGRERLAEQAVDIARSGDLDPAEELARRVLGPASSEEVIGRARAGEALGRVLAWRGDEMSARAAERILGEVCESYRQLGTCEWYAHAVFWRGNAVRYQHGDLAGAEADMVSALGSLDAHSPRRGVILTFYADLLTMHGRWDEVRTALAEATELAHEHGDALTSAYISWAKARMASLRADASGTERALRETERHIADWFDISTGSTFLADAAELLDRVGMHDSAEEYLRRAQARDPDDEFVLQAEAALLARRGDPGHALEALRALTHAPWLEVRLTWRRTLLTAYASLRAHRDGAASLAARALEQAEALCDARIALVGEPEIAAAMVPLAAQAGSRVALELLAPGNGLVVRVLGRVTVIRGGETIELPIGKPGVMVRMLSLAPAGLEVDEVVEQLWPEQDPKTGRRRLRDTLSRLRSRCGDVVVREGTRLRLASGWVDAVAFRQAADRALAGHGREQAALAVAALGLWGGDPLPSDPYEAWALGPREQLLRRRLELLDVLAADAAARGSLDEARLTLEQAIEADPYDETRYVLAAAHLQALGRREPARRMLDRAAAVLSELGLDPTGL
jgi:DNA-binding SARP family transcriptional activator